MATATMVDIYRADEDSCLLGTDAVRDGVDVPGRSLRLIVFDRVPWPRPDILHRARKPVFAGFTASKSCPSVSSTSARAASIARSEPSMSVTLV